MNKKISCIMPSFNRLEQARSRIYDIQNQNYSNWELIIVDDGSTQNYDSLLTKDNRIILIRLPSNSASVSIPRNIGITHCTGEYICHIDDDVVQHPNKLFLLSNLLDNYDTDLVFGQRLEIRDNLLIDVPARIEWDPSLPNGWGVDNGQIMYRKSVYEKIDLVFSRRACDYELAKQIKKYSKPFISTPQKVCTYVWHKSNRSLDDSTIIKPIYPSKFKEFFNWGNIPDKI